MGQNYFVRKLHVLMLYANMDVTYFKNKPFKSYVNIALKLIFRVSFYPSNFPKGPIKFSEGPSFFKKNCMILDEICIFSLF